MWNWVVRVTGQQVKQFPKGTDYNSDWHGHVAHSGSECFVCYNTNDYNPIFFKA